MRAYADQLLQTLRTKQPAMEQFLGELVLAETPSRDPAAQDPIFDILAKKFHELGFATERIRGEKTGGYLIARAQESPPNTPYQLLIGHCDTVWPRGTIEQMPLAREDKKLKGPGVFDMKAGLAQILFAIEAIQDLNLPLEVMPVCLINSDEEIGSRESTPAIERLAREADRAFVLEPPLGLEGKLKTARKGLGRFTLTVRGKAAHAGLDPGQGASAILELSHQVQQLFALNDYERGITVNVGMVEGGESANVVAPLSRAVIDVRAPTQEDAEAVSARIRNLKPIHPDTKIEIEGSFGRPPMERTPRNRDLWRKARQSARTLGLELEEAAAGGGSDANTTSQYTATLDGLGTPGDGAHAVHEFIFPQQMAERTALLALLLLLPATRKSNDHE